MSSLIDSFGMTQMRADPPQIQMRGKESPNLNADSD
jgi:hypothetical protein